jgi:molybdopterin-binding protein
MKLSARNQLHGKVVDVKHDRAADVDADMNPASPRARTCSP